MKKRVGNDLKMTWTILRSGEAEVFDNATNIKIYAYQINTSTSNIEVDFVRNSNVFSLNIPAGSLNVGTYDLRLTYNKVDADIEGGVGSYAIDEHEAFQIVKHTEAEDAAGTDITGEVIYYHDSYVYIASASSALGADFTYPANISQDYLAILNSTTEIPEPSVTDFEGLWFSKIDAYRAAVIGGYTGTMEEFFAEEQNRVEAEILRESNEDSRKANELIRVASESTRVNNELNRQNAESNRVTAESDRVDAEILRESNEDTRESNEVIRQENEALRVSAENIRISNEGDATSGRVKAENDRVAAETLRQQQEAARAQAETARNVASNVYNITLAVPLTAGQYYTSTTARAAVPSGVRKRGLELLYETASGVWYCERFIGASVTTWTTPTDWEVVPTKEYVDDEITKIINLGALYKGVAIPSTNPGTPDGPVFYLASTSGTYPNFGVTGLPGEIFILSNVTGSWAKSTLSLLSSKLGNSDNQGVTQKRVTFGISVASKFLQNKTLSISESISPSTNGDLIAIPLLQGIQYELKLTTNTGTAPTNLNLLKEDGTYYQNVTGSPTGSTTGGTFLFTPSENYVGFYLYYGSASTATSGVIQLTILTVVDTNIAESTVLAENIYPDPFFLKATDLINQPGVTFLNVVGTPVYEEGKITLPAGSFLGIELDLTILGLNPLTEYFNSIVKANVPTNGLINIGISNVTAGLFNAVWGNMSQDSSYPGWYSMYNKTGYSSVNSRIRLTLDNRTASANMVVYGAYIWKGQNVKPLGLFLRDAWKAWNKSKYLKPVQYNYAPGYEYFDITTGLNIISQSPDSFEFIALVSPGIFGFDFELSQSPFSVGDTIHYAALNVETDPVAGRLYCIFYNGLTEISRVGVLLSNSAMIKQSGVIPVGTTRILFRYQSSVIDQNIKAGKLYISKENISDPANTVWIDEPIFGGGSSTDDIRYIDAVNGLDTNTGLTFASAFKTFSKAIDSTGNNTTIIFKGDTTESINIKQKSSQRSLTIIGATGLKNRIIKGTKITGATLYGSETDVYQVPVDSFSTGTKFQLFQHDIDDVSTLIPSTERHPLQKGKVYRCDSTIIRRTTSLANVLASSDLLFYYDSTAQILYFRVVAGSDINSNPVYIPGGFAISGNDGSVDLKLINIEALYGTFQLAKCHGAQILDCSAKYGLGVGGFAWDLAIGITFTRCEATRTFTGETTGDGFNAHSAYQSPDTPFAKHSTGTMIDCWSHDNNDDGYSDHERCETSIIGGLFEYNVKAGLTPAYGAHDTIIGSYCRKNVNGGISLVGGAAVSEGGVGSQIVVRDCISEDNTNNYTVSGDTGLYINEGVFINCISRRASGVGYLAGSNSKVTLINCYDSGSTVIKSGATLTVENSNLVI